MPDYQSWQEQPKAEAKNVVSAMHKCQTSDAKYLCIFETGFKLKTQGEYDIGGTYTKNRPDLWFYFSTSFCPGNKFLLNLFVCLRKAGSFDIGVSNSNEMDRHTDDNNDQRACLPSELKWQVFRSSQAGERFYVRTYSIPADNITNLTLCIPISITAPGCPLNSDLVKQVKLNHDFGELLSKQEKTNFIVQSGSGKQYQVHKIVLAAHSPVLRNMVKSDTVMSLFLDISDNDMELLLQFLYTGTIKDIMKQDCLNILDIAGKFELDNLFRLVQYAIAEQIDVANCMEIALISEKYKLETLQINIFKFVKNNPKVFETDGWRKLDDVNLTKKLVRYLHQ